MYGIIHGMHKLTKEQEVEIFKRLAFKPTLAVGLEFNLDQHYKDNKAIKNAILRIYREIKERPAEFGVSPEVVQLVADAMAHRNLAKTTVDVSKAETEADQGDIKTLALTVRDKAWRLLDKKLTRASKSKKALDAIPLLQLSTTAATMLDKTLILQGQATEHIAIMGKIEGNINPEDALKLVLLMREKNIAQHETKK
jgi:hypothetical protein